MFGFIYVTMNFVFWSMGGQSVGTEALHLSGFLVGFPVGFFMRYYGFVDCEGFDLLLHKIWRFSSSKSLRRSMKRILISLFRSPVTVHRAS